MKDDKNKKSNNQNQPNESIKMALIFTLGAVTALTIVYLWSIARRADDPNHEENQGPDYHNNNDDDNLEPMFSK